MKSLLKNSLILALVASFVALYSCKTEDPIVEFDAPTMTASIKVNGTAATSPATVEVGDVVTGDFTILAPGTFNVLRIRVAVDGTTTTTIELPRTQITGVTDFTDFDVTGLALLTVEEEDADKTIELTFEVVDDQDKTGTAPAFSMDVVIPDPEARSYSAVLLAAPTGDFANENFFSVATGSVYSRNEVNATTEAISATIDFGYYYGSTEGASIASPKGFEATTFAAQVQGWGTKNETILKTTTLTSAQFLETTTFGAIDVAFAAGTTDTNGIITNLTEGTVLAFQTVGGVKGLILISEIEAGFESNDYVKIDVIAQLDAE